MANPKIEVEIGAVTDGLIRGLDGSILSLKQLTTEAKKIEIALESATDVKSINTYNSQLANLRNGMQKLKTTGIDPLTKATSNYNGVGIEFSRIIQDAPFGIIGVGNNITQLAGSFQQLRSSSTSTGAALKTAFASIISPANLLVLGISAVTTALTLYSMSASSAKTPINELKDAQDDYNESLKETDRLLGREVFSQFLKEVGLVQQQNIGGKLIDIPTFTSAVEVVDKLSGKISTLRKGELELLAKFFQTQIAESLRSAQSSAGTFAEELAKQDVGLYTGLLEKVNVQLNFYKTNTDKGKDSTKGLNKEAKELQQVINAFSTDPLVDAYFEAIKKGAEFRDSLGKAASGLTGMEGKNPFTSIENQITSGLISSGPPVTEFAEQFQEQASGISAIADELVGVFSGLGNQIANSFNISNDALRGFVGTLLSNTPKIIQAIFQQAAAKKLASKSVVASNIEEGTSGAVVVGIEAAKGLGPVGLALLPVLVGGALAIVSGAFKKGGGGGGSVGAGVSGQSFTGGGVGGLGGGSRELTGELVVRGNDLVYVLGQSMNKITKG